MSVIAVWHYEKPCTIYVFICSADDTSEVQRIDKVNKRERRRC